MNIKNKIYHTVYFLLFGIIVGILLKRKELLTKQDNGKAVPC